VEWLKEELKKFFDGGLKKYFDGGCKIDFGEKKILIIFTKGRGNSKHDLAK